MCLLTAFLISIIVSPVYFADISPIYSILTSLAHVALFHPLRLDELELPSRRLMLPHFEDTLRSLNLLSGESCTWHGKRWLLGA